MRTRSCDGNHMYCLRGAMLTARRGPADLLLAPVGPEFLEKPG
jgi:hypothetical protein